MVRGVCVCVVCVLCVCVVCVRGVWCVCVVCVVCVCVCGVWCVVCVCVWYVCCVCVCRRERERRRRVRNDLQTHYKERGKEFTRIAIL